MYPVPPVVLETLSPPGTWSHGQPCQTKQKKGIVNTHLFHGAGSGWSITARRCLVGFLSSRFVIRQTQTKRNHLVDAVGKVLRLLEREAGCEQRRLVEQHRQIPNSAVCCIFLHFALELLGDGMVRVDLQCLFALHVRRHARITQGLRLHNALHVGRPAELACCEHSRGILQEMRHRDLFDLLPQVVLHHLAQVFKGSLVSLGLGLLFFSFLDFDAVLGDADQLVAIELLQLRDGVFIDCAIITISAQMS